MWKRDNADKCSECGYILKEEVKDKKNDIHIVKKEIFKNKKVKIVSIVGVIVLVLIGIFFATGNLRDYYKAVGLLEDKKYQVAKNEFIKLDGYKDSNIKIQECEYQMALSYIENEEYEKAVEILKNPLEKKYKDSQEQKNFCEYQMATQHYNDKDYSFAIQKFASLADENYKDSTEMLVKAKYDLGKKYLNEKSYEEGINLLKSIDYKDSSQLVESVENNPYSFKKFIERYNSMAEQIEKVNAGVSIKRLDANNLRDDVITTGLGAEIRFNRSTDEEIDCRYNVVSFMWDLSPWILADSNTITAEWHCCVAGIMPDFKMNEISDLLVEMVESSGEGIYGSTEYENLFLNISKTKKEITISGQKTG